ncbi:MAG: ABC transporter permease, partial [Methanoregula sp.]|nr:ABC transporter permease [Methanoregula sp.]
LPSPREDILFGKILFITIRGIIQATVILLIAIMIGATILSPVQYAMTYVILILFGILFSGLATTLALYIDDHDTYAAVNTLISMPLFFTSSALMPYSVMPSWMRSIAMVNPLSFAIDAIRSVGLGEVPLMQMGLLFGVGGIVLIVCVQVFRNMTV